MSSINNNNKSKTNKEVNKKSLRNDFFNLDIKDDIFDPFKDDFFNFDSFENKMFKNIFNIFDTKKETQDSLELNTYKVVIECKKHKSCDLYPSNLDCDAEGGLVTNGSTTAYNLGLASYSFGNDMLLKVFFLHFRCTVNIICIIDTISCKKLRFGAFLEVFF